jgi:hypothetical protein
MSSAYCRRLHGGRKLVDTIYSNVSIFFGSTAAMLMNQVRAIARQREYRSGIVSVSCMIDCALGHGERHPFYDGVCQIIVES